MKVFRLEEANALLAVLRPLVHAMVDKRRDLAIKLLEADTAARMTRGADGAQRAATVARQAQELHAELSAAIDAVQKHGCTVKDLDLGLLDFPALRGGQLVNLCWKLDEPAIGFWHGMDEGFASRRSISRRRRSQ
ncbi:MAG: DUF2203 domain-containing protein [Candidatus Eremiobacteraeota bacterium]|nr:DUF2203 domain-containing protein [Candidatus Eremiobacteraeota bacterium]